MNMNGFGTNFMKPEFITPFFGVILGIFIICIIIYVIVQVSIKRPISTLMGPIDLYQPTSAILIDRSITKSEMARTYTVSFFIRIDAVPDMRSDATPLISWPGIWDLNYNPAFEQLVWNVTQTSIDKLTPPSPSPSPSPSPIPIPKSSKQQVTLQPVPLQRWTQVSLGFEGRTMDLYINGDLIKSFTLDKLPPATISSIAIQPGGIMGQLAYIQLWSRRLTVREIGANYIDTSDSTGQPNLGPTFINALKNISLPNIFVPKSCSDNDPTAPLTQTWEYPYA